MEVMFGGCMHLTFPHKHGGKEKLNRIKVIPLMAYYFYYAEIGLV